MKQAGKASGFITYKSEIRRLLAKGQNGGGWKIRFVCEECEDSFASCTSNPPHRTVTFAYNPKSNIGRSTAEVKQTAKHEYGHFVVARLFWLATCRYVDPSEIDEEGEHIARVFEALL